MDQGVMVHACSVVLNLSEAVVMPYVDNAIVWTWSPDEEPAACSALCQSLDEVGLVYRTETRDAVEYQGLGYVFDARVPQVVHTDSRTWKLHFGLPGLRHQGKCSPKLLQIANADTFAID